MRSPACPNVPGGVVRHWPLQALWCALAMGLWHGTACEGAADTIDGLAPADPIPAPAGRVVWRDEFRQAGEERWEVRPGSQWEWMELKDEEAGKVRHVYALTEIGPPGRIRAPMAWSLVRDLEVGEVVLTAHGRVATARSVPGRDLILFFGYQGPEQFYYVHFSAENSAVHNVVMRVNGADREKLPHLVQPVPRLLSDGFHTIRIWHQPDTGDIIAWCDDMEVPIMHARDEERLFRRGRVGIGSFDDLGWFDWFEVKVPASQ